MNWESLKGHYTTPPQGSLAVAQAKTQLAQSLGLHVSDRGSWEEPSAKPAKHLQVKVTECTCQALDPMFLTPTIHTNMMDEFDLIQYKQLAGKASGFKKASCRSLSDLFTQFLLDFF